MRVAVVAMPEMDHFIPTIHLAGALQERGHLVTIIVSKVAREKTENFIADSGCKAQVTNDDCEREDMHPDKGGRKWIPFLREAFIHL